MSSNFIVDFREVVCVYNSFLPATPNPIYMVAFKSGVTVEITGRQVFEKFHEYIEKSTDRNRMYSPNTGGR
tara:strand:- start:3432 stop:3644 length:213 start_codon:yes stop_codon:yes gene_type:complete